MSEVERLRAKKKQIYEDLKDAVDHDKYHMSVELAGNRSHKEFLQDLEDWVKDDKREWKNLTDQEILDALGVFSAEEAVFRIARAVEAKLKEKNT